MTPAGTKQKAIKPIGSMNPKRQQESSSNCDGGEHANQNPDR